MGLENTISYEKVNTFDAQTMRSRLNSLDLDDNESVEEWALDLTASLCAFNTSTTLGDEFNQMQHYILEVMEDQIKKADLNTKFVRSYLKSEDNTEAKPLPRQMLVVYPFSEKQLMDDLEFQYLSKQKGKPANPVYTSKNIVLLHLDTYGELGKLASLETFIDKMQNIAYAKGFVDMKLSITATILAQERLIREGHNDLPIIFFGVDEEQQAIYGGSDFLRLLRTTGYIYDPECNPNNTAFVVELSPRVSIYVDEYELLPKELIELRRRLINCFGEVAIPIIDNSTGDLNISLMSNNKDYQEMILDILLDMNIIQDRRHGHKSSFEGVKSSITIPTLQEIDQIMAQTYAYEERALPVGTVGSISLKHKDFRHIGAIYNNFLTMSTITYKPQSNDEENVKWGIVGAMEQGTGRHTKKEGAQINHIIKVANTLAKLLKLK